MPELAPRKGHSDVFTYDVVPDEDEKNPVPIPKQAKNAIGPHIYNPNTDSFGKRIGYQKIKVTSLGEYPKVLYRPATKEEIAERRQELTEEMWMDVDFDLLKETGMNQRKRHTDYERWITRPIDVTVNTREEEEAFAKKAATKAA